MKNKSVCEESTGSSALGGCSEDVPEPVPESLLGLAEEQLDGVGTDELAELNGGEDGRLKLVLAVSDDVGDERGAAVLLGEEVDGSVADEIGVDIAGLGVAEVGVVEEFAEVSAGFGVDPVHFEDGPHRGV